MTPDLDEMEAVRTHATIWTGIQENGGTATSKYSESHLYETRFLGGIQANAGFVTEVVTLVAEFGIPAGAVSFLVYIRPILIKWIEMRSGRSIEIQLGEKRVKIQGGRDVDRALELFRELDNGRAVDDQNE